jgi:hypothetical protein
MYKFLKTLHPGGDSNRGSSVLYADAVTTMSRRRVVPKTSAFEKKQK